MQVGNNTQVKQDRSTSSGTGSAISNKSGRFASDRISAEPTITESLSLCVVKLEPPIVGIQERIEKLETKLETASSPAEHKFIGIQLYIDRGELKAESLKLIENELMGRNDTPRSNSDAPQEPLGTGTMTRADLEALAAGDEDDPMAIAARTILNEPRGFESIAGKDENIDINLPWGGDISFTIPATMTLDEIQAARLDAERDMFA